MADSDKPPKRAGGSGGTRPQKRGGASRSTAARPRRARKKAEPVTETEVEPDDLRLERLRAVLERKATFG
jgi:hypothetical protein